MNHSRQQNSDLMINIPAYKLQLLLCLPAFKSCA